MIKRIFFPIGQGAFYAEIHGEFNIVYDCGNWKQTNLSKKIVKQSFTKNDDIDILFISHLDWDHISLLETLKKTVKSIHNVILPLLHDDKKIFLRKVYHGLGYSSLDIIDNPIKFFGNNTNIIYVSPSESNETNDLEDETIILAGNNNIPREVNSGRVIKLVKDHYNWCFVPFNIENKQRNEILERELKKAGFDVDKLKTDTGYTLTKLTTKKDKNKLKKIYNSLEGKINENSLVIYSGPASMQNVHYNYVSHYHSNFCGYSFQEYLLDYDNLYYSKKVGCIYTGDIDLNKFDITRLFNKYWDVIGTIQIPHHGSIYSFEQSFLRNGPFICPISYATNNSYGHPSYNVIADIVSHGSHIINITEKVNSGYIQSIR